MRRRMARTKKKVDPFEFPGSDDESDDDDKLSAKRKRRNSGNSTPHSVNGLDDGGGSTCRDEDGGRSTCRAKLCFPGSGNQSDTWRGTGSSEEGDEEDDEESGRGTGSSEEGDEGDDEESGRGSSDNDDKIHCSICAGEILEEEILEDSCLTARCGHHVCEFCHQDALEHLDHVKKGNAHLDTSMMEFCGLSDRVCLHEWPPEFVFPKRIIALRGVALSSKILPKTSLDLNPPEGGGHGLFHRPFFDVDRLVKGIPFPSSISIDDARKIGLKVPKNHRGGKIQLCPLETEDTKIGFPGYPYNHQHPRSLETVAPGSSAVSSTRSLWRVAGLGSFFDTKLGTYLPLPLPNASGSRIDGEAVFLADGSPSIACSKCGKYWSRKTLVSAKCGSKTLLLFDRAMVSLKSTHTHTHTHTQTHTLHARTLTCVN